MTMDALTSMFFEALTTPESLVQALDRIIELEAKLAVVPKWTRITDDPATWPPSDRSKIVNCYRSNTGEWEYEVRSSDYFRLAIEGMIPLEESEYWLPITPPTEAA